MDIAELVTYDQAFTVKLRHPVTGAETGISMDVVSFDSERVAKIARAIENEKWSAVFASEDRKLSHTALAEFVEKEQREKIIAAVVGWDFSDMSFGDLAAGFPCNDENKRYVFSHANAAWVRNQIIAHGDDLRNFSPPPQND